MESYSEPAGVNYGRDPSAGADHSLRAASPAAQRPSPAAQRPSPAAAAPSPAAGHPSLTAGRIVVVSPHLDDAILSLGATIARAARAGAQVEVLTVFGCRPFSAAAAGEWDSKSGFRTEGEAAQVRRREDLRACSLVGATPRWLNFGGEPYERRATPREIQSAVLGALTGADCALIPGFPLTHRDHAELTRLLLNAHLPCRVGLYAEQPYLFYERKALQPAMRAEAIEQQLMDPLEWTHRRAHSWERRMKMRAVRCYRSQMWQLGLSHVGLYRMMWHERSLGGEAIAWLPRSYGDAPTCKSTRNKWKASRPLPGGGKRAPAGALPLDE